MSRCPRERLSPSDQSAIAHFRGEPEGAASIDPAKDSISLAPCQIQPYTCLSRPPAASATARASRSRAARTAGAGTGIFAGCVLDQVRPKIRRLLVDRRVGAPAHRPLKLAELDDQDRQTDEGEQESRPRDQGLKHVDAHSILRSRRADVADVADVAGAALAPPSGRRAERRRIDDEVTGRRSRTSRRPGVPGGSATVTEDAGR